MRQIVRHIASRALWLSVLCIMSSCVYERDYADYPQTGDDRKTMFVLHITPMSMRGAQSSDRVVEKIRTLRVIAISRPENDSDGANGEGTIEINRLITFADEPSTSDFSYSLTWTTTPGKKDFYIFANEDEVYGSDNGYLQFAANDKIPADVKVLSSLKELFDRYKATPNPEQFELSDNADNSSDNKTADTDADASAKEFKTVIDAVYFAPEYRIVGGEDDNSGSMQTKRSIFLPYSSCYEGVEVEGGEKISKEMFLVPVATKFYFRFYNYHKSVVKVQKLTLEHIDSENFLLGNVSSEEQTKVFNSNPDEPGKNQEYYWVDWLARVADATHKNLTPDNSDINEQYGWIFGYSMPDTSQQSVQTLIGDGGGGLVGGQERMNEAAIAAVGPLEDMAGELYLGPYYFPESRFLITYKDENNKDVLISAQQYTLGLHLHDTDVDSSTSNDFKEDLVIGNIRSLFRDTCVLIQISMRDGDIEVYAEMAPWEHKEVDGWADGGDIIP